MDIDKQEYRLKEGIAAVRLADIGEDVTGVVVVIPAGEIISLDRTAPIVGPIRQIEWNESRYGVFPDDLFKRTDKLSEGNPHQKAKSHHNT